MFKKTLSFLLLLVIFSSAAYTQTNFKKYPFESGIIKYKWEGMMEGEQTTYFDNYGYYEATYQNTKTTVMGFTTESKEITIMRGAEQYTIDPETNTAVKITNPVLESFEENPNQDWEKVSKEMIEGLNFKKIGNESIVGKSCEVYSGMGSKVWIWKGLSLKTDTKGMGVNAVVTATDVQVDVSVPAEKFEIPEGVTVSDNPVFEGGDDEEVPENMKEMMKGFKNMFNNDDDDED